MLGLLAEILAMKVFFISHYGVHTFTQILFLGPMRHASKLCSFSIRYSGAFGRQRNDYVAGGSATISADVDESIHTSKCAVMGMRTQSP